HGATFASEEISEESEAKRPSVQVGDPFTEKLLLEASLEALKTGAVVGMQDMGAAGIACSTSEMSEKGNAGMRINLDHVPAREDGMTAYELLLSESQERMLVVVEKGREQEVLDVYHKWDLQAVMIGEVTEGDRVVYEKDGEVKADIPAESLVLGGGAPQYVREATRPAYLDVLAAQPDPTFDADESFGESVKTLMGSPNIASKRWVFEQYDTMVRTNTVVGPGESDAGVIRLKGSKKGLAIKTDCNAKYVYLNPHRGGMIAVAESARNVVCAGGKPVAITNCLNFGNPYKPEVYWTFKEALRGMGDACRALEAPVTGGNVSFYNENPTGAIYPTPTIGMLGIVEDVDAHAMTASFKQAGDQVFYLGASRQGLDGSEYLDMLHETKGKDAPAMDLDEELRAQAAVLEAIRSGLVNAAHDVSAGGLAVTLAEMAVFGGFGAECALDSLAESMGVSMREALFSEAQSGVVVTVDGSDAKVAKNMAKALHELCEKHQIPLYSLGHTGGAEQSLEDVATLPATLPATLTLGADIHLDVTELHTIYESAPFAKA
ncbi:MAG: phosphoribosylformylglycinamidine synthase subunit PurL, partial [Balneolaceae bacterium]|nr:phosphoribosylformylglycinamidine synthase subunit PurL [Balneolaceae bacterium]